MAIMLIASPLIAGEINHETHTLRDTSAHLPAMPGSTVRKLISQREHSTGASSRPNNLLPSSSILNAASVSCQLDADCDDANVCTDDRCLANVCEISVNTFTCDDGDTCTENDVCNQGTCLGTVIGSVACAPLFTIKVAAINGVDLVGGASDQVIASRGDTITLELYANRWAPRKILAYNLLIDSQSFFSGTTGAILPIINPDPNAVVFIDTSRLDFIFAGLDVITRVFNTSLDFIEYLGVVADTTTCVDDPSVEAYLGSLIVDVSDTASGTFHICPQAFFDEVNVTFLTNCPDPTVIEPSAFACATIDIPLGNCAQSPDCNTNGQWDICDISSGLSQDCNRNDVPDECDINDNTSADCNQNLIPDECDIANNQSADCDVNSIPDECEPDCNANGITDACDILSFFSDDCNGDGIPDDCARFFVDVTATGVGDGSSWDNAFPSLQSAIIAMLPMCGPGREIWVAQGTYYPDVANGDRSSSFRLLKGVAIYGGFLGVETSLNERSVGLLTTVLSGDLNGNDSTDSASTQDNSYHVVSASNANVSSILDGFVIRDGNADGINDDANGAGLHLTASSPAIINSLIIGNYAANDGGGVWTIQGRPSFINCIFNGNQANKLGGGMRHVTGIPIVTHGTFTGNIAGLGGGGLFSGNSDASNNLQNIPSSVRIANSIFWDNEELQPFNQRESAQIVAAVPDVDYSCVQNLSPQFGGIGNISDDPLFIDANGMDDMFGNLDDNFRLALGSPCIDKGLDLAAMITAKDFEGRPRVDQCQTDMGAYESPFFADCDTSGVSDACEIEEGLVTDCDNNLTPDACEIDCNGNGVADSCEIDDGSSLDCNNNAVPDECEIDCNLNNIPDDCDLNDSTSTDCNHNNVPDECDVVSGVSSDCNNNDLSDDCEVREPFAATSRRLTPLSSGNSFSFFFGPAPQAIDDVSLTFLGRGDFLDADEFVSVFVGGVFIDDIFVTNARECASFGFDVDRIVMPTIDFNQAIQQGGAIIQIVSSDAVDATTCPTPSDMLIFVSYDGPSMADCNANVIPDDCEVDTDGDNVIDTCDQCPNDPNKSTEGTCGCGVSDADSDLDTVPDCIDQCPNFDDQADFNNDGTPDCIGRIPTLSSWGMLILLLLFLIVAKTNNLSSNKNIQE